MHKAVKIILWIVGSLIAIALLLVLVVGPMVKKNTKKNSPEVTEIYTSNHLEIAVFYCSPSKKGRVIFGDLVPYGEVWRTGANEASTFTTNTDLSIGGKTLAAGKYSLWTIPSVGSWQVIFNSKMYDWGVKFTDSKASRDPQFDVLVTTSQVSKNYVQTEDFSIRIIEIGEELLLVFAWDDVTVPIVLEY